MPPFLSSLAAALLSPQRRAKPTPADVFTTALPTITSRRLYVQEEHLTQQLEHLQREEQPPVVALAVAYALFLLGRGASAASAPARPKPLTNLLPVRLDLLNDDHVVAEHLPSDTEIPISTIAAAAYTVIGENTTELADLGQASDLRGHPRDIAVVTTAAMPWMTGTSINPALRAVYLAKDHHRVTLVVPWLPQLAQQTRLFSKGSPTFNSQQEQREYIQQWAQNQVTGVHIDVLFYEGVYVEELGSILPVGAITDVFQPDHVNKDVCILEEPEHLTWHHSGKVWTELFTFVVGIIHTNYIEYAKKFGFFGPQKSLALTFLNVWVCRGYCHRIIKLSDAVQEFPNSVTHNVHGVRDKFINIGRNRSGHFPRGAYFMGKVLWAKGYRDLIDHMIDHYYAKDYALPIDFFGAGPDVPAVREELETSGGLSAVTFDARVADHTGEYLQGYKVFVNASRSDVVCTATAEALAMGKLVVCLEHPSNEFFATFPNCITYGSSREFSDAVEEALRKEPVPLSDYDAERLSWEAATERLYDAMRMPLSKSKPSKVGHALAKTHATLSKIYPQPGTKAKKAITREIETEESSCENSVQDDGEKVAQVE